MSRTLGREINLEHGLTNQKVRLRCTPSLTVKPNNHERRWGWVWWLDSTPRDRHFATRLFRSQHHGGQRACREGS